MNSFVQTVVSFSYSQVMDDMVGGVKVYKRVKGVRCINVCDVLVHLYGSTAFKGWDPTVNRSHEEENAAVHEWSARHRCSMYAAPREDFNLYEAAKLALREGNTIVIFEDLSLKNQKNALCANS